MKPEDSKKKKKKLTETIEIPEGVDVKIDNDLITVKAKGETKKEFKHKQIVFVLDGKQIKISSKRNSKREKTMIGTIKAHINNMIKGAKEPHKYMLKICSGHFPMNVSVSKEEFVVKNFLGEKVPRVLKLKEGVNVKIEGDMITIEGADKEVAGQVAADIEQLTKRRNYDTRIFQDGIYILNKCGKEMK